MATDIYLDPVTNDIYLENDTTIKLCSTKAQLTRQRVLITLSTFMGEWFANVLFGTPYFQTIYGKGTKSITDVTLKGIIQNVEGVVELLKYESSLDNKERKLTVSFTALVEDGEIIEIELVV